MKIRFRLLDVEQKRVECSSVKRVKFKAELKLKSHKILVLVLYFRTFHERQSNKTL